MSDTPLRLKPRGFFSRGFSPWRQRIVFLSRGQRELRARREHLAWEVPSPPTTGETEMSPDTFEYTCWFAYPLLVLSVAQWPWSLAHTSVFTRRSDLLRNPQALFSFQGTRGIFSQRRAKVEMHEMQGVKPGTPNYGGRDPVACGGLKPFSVNDELDC